MNKHISNYSFYKLYIWKLIHSLINYFFNIYVKKRYNINDNCYLYFKKLGYYNKILINYIQFRESQYFSVLNLRLIKLILNLDNKIPIFSIGHINFTPKHFQIDKIYQSFSVWTKSLNDTVRTIQILEQLLGELSKFIVININSITINYECLKFSLKKVKLLKNDHKTRIIVNKISIFYRGNYCCSIKNFKLSHDCNSNTINIFGKKILIIINNYILKYNIVRDISEILSKFIFNETGKAPNIYFDHIELQLLIHNHITFNFHKVINEKNLIKLDGNIKIWKKEIFWITGCTYNLSNNALNINNIRIRLFKSTADKLYKSFRPIYKQYYNRKPPRLKSTFKKISTLHPNHNYMHSLTCSEKTIDNLSYDKSEIICKSNYISNEIEQTIVNLFRIDSLQIDFQDNKSTFLFKQFIYSNISNGIRISASKWLFKKNKEIYLDSYENSGNFIVEYQDNSLSIYPYKLVLNLDLDIFSQTFGLFADSIGKIIDIFVIHRLHQNYIYDKFYIHSSRIIFSYQSKHLQFFKLLSGKYSELVNILELNNMNFILRPITITYAKNFTNILGILLNKLLEDIIENNFETLIKATPAALSYRISKKIKSVRQIANKCYNIISNNQSE